MSYLNFMVKKCGRQHCLCQKKIQELSLRIPLNFKEEASLKEQLTEKKKEYRFCYTAWNHLQNERDLKDL